MIKLEAEQSFLNRRVIIFPYDNNWPKKFELESEKILSVIGYKEVVVEHIGSTAINGLSAKPIIDIMVGVNSLAVADDCIQPLAAIGYDYVPELEKNFPNRRYFHRGPNLPNKHFHLHMVEEGSDFWKRQLFFRDYLRKHFDIAMEYQKLKEELAVRHQNSVFDYTEEKGEFIRGVLGEM